MRNAVYLMAVLLLAAVVLKLGIDNRGSSAENQRLTVALDQAKREQSRAKAQTATLTREVDALKTQQEQRKNAEARKTGSAETATLTSAGATPAVTVGAMQTTTTAKADKDKSVDFMGRFGEIMKKPEMQDAMRAQQKMMLSTMYGSLFKKLNLTPDALDKLKEVLVNRQMTGIKMLGAGDKKAALADITETEKQTEQTVKELLGDEQYKVYQDYQATLGERMTLGQLNQQLTEKSMALDDVQQEELITLMVAERQKLKIGSALEQQQAWAASGTPSGEVIEKQLQQQEELNQLILARAGEVLSEAQQKELKAFQENQAQMQKLGLQMMKNFMSSDKKE